MNTRSFRTSIFKRIGFSGLLDCGAGSERSPEKLIQEKAFSVYLYMQNPKYMRQAHIYELADPSFLKAFEKPILLSFH